MLILRIYLKFLNCLIPSALFICRQGCRNPGGDGGCIPTNNLTVSPPIIWLWSAFERRSPLEFGEKKCSNFGEELFLFGLHLICSPEKNCGRGSFPPMLKIGQNRGEIVNFPPTPMLNKDRHPCLQIKFRPRLNVRSQTSQRGRGCFGSLGAEPPKAIGDLGAKPPAAGGWRSGGKAYSRRRHGGLGTEPQRSKILHFVAKITQF